VAASPGYPQRDGPTLLARCAERHAMILDDRQRSFVAAGRTATLATIAPSGLPRLVPICFIVGADAPDGRPLIYSPLDEKSKQHRDPRQLARVRDILGRPEATLLVDRWSEDWTRLGWVRLDTRVEMIEPEQDHVAERTAAIDALRVKYPQYAEHRLEDRPIVRFTVLRAVWWGMLDSE
jgi:PPOX class probable F420-dependent enzyme